MKSTSGHCEEHFVARGYTVCVGRQEGVSTGQDHTALGGYLVVHGLWREGAGGGRGPYAVRTPSGLAPRGRGRAAATTETGADRGCAGARSRLKALRLGETPLMALAICRLQVAVVQH